MTKSEALKVLRVHHNAGSITADELTRLDPATRKLYDAEYAAFYNGGENDAQRDASSTLRTEALTKAVIDAD